MLDTAAKNTIYFQEPATSIMCQIIEFHNIMLSTIFGICIVVIYMVQFSTRTFSYNAKWRWSNRKPFREFSNPYISEKYRFYDGLPHDHWQATALEIVWTIVPSILLVFLAMPTFSTLYAFEKEYEVDMNNTFIITGNQWYWDYEYSDTIDLDEINQKNKALSEAIEYSSFMIPTEDLEKGQLRLLETDTQLIVPIEARIRFIITSSDVIHCFAVPSLGIKLDAVPGRLNQLMCVIKRTGYFYGQCSEICGVDHGFMPINVIAI